MTPKSVETYINESIPDPLRSDSFCLLRKGIWDDANACVYINSTRNFAFIYPPQEVDYSNYNPRVKKLSLTNYRKQNQVIHRRLSKIRKIVEESSRLLEIGAADGEFLRAVNEVNPKANLACLEPDENTRQLRNMTNVTHFSSFEEVRSTGVSFDSVCLFHVFEHIVDPVPFLARCVSLLSPGGHLIIEIPSLDDPLLSLYSCLTYEDFYFQVQHPYVYSGESLKSLIEDVSGLSTAIVPYQRYGLENHLTWLSEGRPGGSDELRALFSDLDQEYRHGLESSGKTDTVFAIVKADG